MLTTPPNVRHISWSNLNFSTSWSDPTSQHHGRTPTSHYHGQNSTLTLCLNGREPNCLPTWPKVNFQLTCFSKFPNSQPISSGHDIIHTPAPFPIWDLLWQLWLSYPLHVSVNCTQCYVLYSHLHHHSASQRRNIKDRRMNKRRTQ